MVNKSSVEVLEEIEIIVCAFIWNGNRREIIRCEYVSEFV